MNSLGQDREGQGRELLLSMLIGGKVGLLYAQGPMAHPSSLLWAHGAALAVGKKGWGRSQAAAST